MGRAWHTLNYLISTNPLRILFCAPYFMDDKTEALRNLLKFTLTLIKSF